MTEPVSGFRLTDEARHAAGSPRPPQPPRPTQVLKPTTLVLGLLCLMYLITYVDRVNIATAAHAIQEELGLSNTQLGLVLSAFAYPYLLFQVFGGWVGDRFGPRTTLFCCGLVWAGATMCTGLSSGLLMLFLVRVMLGVGEGATFPVATRAMQSWTSKEQRGFAQGTTHAFARFGNAITPPIVAWLMAFAGWRTSFVVLGTASLAWGFTWFWYFRDRPVDHPRISDAELDALPNRGLALTADRPTVPWAALTRRMAPVTVVYFCYGWTLWLYLNWLPSYFLHEYHLNISRSAIFSSVVFFAGVGGDLLGGTISDGILRRTGDLRRARRDVVIGGFAGSFLFLLPLFATHDLTTIVLCLGAAFFCAEIVIGPMWAIPMDIAPAYSGTASGLMNTGSAAAAILSPLAFGWIVDVTGNWQLPFVGSLGLLLAGAVLAFTMRPERPFEAGRLQSQVEPQPHGAKA
ncbi:MAG TPA: MFS transporter [Vicinamibacterales bacterium]|nr:MFS transporter [Vicinamibacterales bacterium]